LGGFWIRQTDNVSQDIANHDNFWVVNKGACSLSTLYGSQGETIGESAAIWASRLNFQIQAPAASISGIVYHGMMTYASMALRDVSFPIATSDLIRTATRQQKLRVDNPVFSMQSAVVNHEVPLNYNQ